MQILQSALLTILKFSLVTLLITSCSILGLEEEEETTTSTSTESSTPTPTPTESDTIETTVAAVAGSGAIETNSTISIIAPKSSGSSSSRSYSRIGVNSIAAINVNTFSSSSDYNKDRASIFVYEESAQALQIVNSIMCQIAQSRPDLMLNAGAYKAQIDEEKCNKQVQDSQEGSGVDYVTWTVEASREENQPMVVKLWVPDDTDRDGTAESTTSAKLTVYHPANSTYPLGFFNLHFQSTNNSDGTENSKGFMRTLKKGEANILEFYYPINHNGTTLENAVRIEIQSDGSGKGRTQNLEWDQNGPTGNKMAYDIAFNENYFYKKKDGGNPACLNRNNFFETAWRNGVYTNSGTRVDINSGFPIKKTLNDKDYYGYVGYYGLWMPEINLSENETVTKLDFTDPSNNSDYRVKTYGGKLYKHTKQALTLSEIKNVPLYWNDQTDSNNQKRVFWNGTKLKYDATRCNSSGCQWQEIDEQELSLNSSNAPYGFWFWSQALGGDGRLDLTYGSDKEPLAPLDNATVIFHTREPVFPGDAVPPTLTCFHQCPEFGNLANGYDNGSQPSVYKQNIWSDNKTGATSGYIYSFSTDSEKMVLKDNESNSIVFNTSNENLEWGVFSGELIEDNSTNREAMVCDWDSSNTKICPWKARETLSHFYSWETGKNEWQKLSVLIDGSGNAVKFDPPMIVKYIRSSSKSNSGKDYNNAKFYLEYNSFGDLWGIPYFCTDLNGNPASCGYNTKWVNEFVIPAGTTVTKVGGGDPSVLDGTEFVVKPLEIEQAMKEVDGPTCAAVLSLGGVSLPDISGYTPPGIGSKPDVDGAPVVIAGVKKN